MTIQGIDLSSWQTVYDYQAVKNFGIKFAISKVTESNWWSDNQASARALLLDPVDFLRRKGRL